MNDYNNRQYKLMLQKVLLFRQDKIEIPDLINGLDGLLNALEDPNPNWKDTFQTEWWELEKVYSIALDQEREYLDSNDLKVIEKALDNIISLINNKITNDDKSEFEI